MGYSIQNSETGEVDYIQFDDSSIIEKPKIDVETGEPLNGKFKVRCMKAKRFQIPKRYLRATVFEELLKQYTDEYRDDVRPKAILIDDAAQKKKPHYAKEDYLKMEGVKNDILLGYNKTTYLMYLVPTLFFCNMTFVVILSILEVLLHLSAHRKNVMISNKSFYFRSPLHILTSHFCAICKSESETDLKIFAMINKQMRKARESKALKDVSMAIG